MSGSLVTLESPSRPRLPELFGKPTQLLGWQGITATIPQTWNLVSFAGDWWKGNLRLADEDGVRLEILWERPKGTPDVARSIERLLQNIARDSKKQKAAFETIETPKLIPRTRKEHADKEQLLNFGWKSEASQAISHGWGASWFCEKTDRVIVAHAVGHFDENAEKSRRLAAEVLSSLQSHGVGGWQTWSAFGLQLEIPDEFHLTGAKLQTGRLELDWERVRPHGAVSPLAVREWGKRPERVGVRRISAANVVLENESLENWALRVATGMWKKHRFSKISTEAHAAGEPALEFTGALKDYRQAMRGWLLDRVLRRRTEPPTLLVWHNGGDNKIFALMCDLWDINARIKTDILDSLESRQ